MRSWQSDVAHHRPARRAVDVEDDGRGELRAAAKLQHRPQCLRQLRVRARDIDRCVTTASAGGPSGPAVDAVQSLQTAPPQPAIGGRRRHCRYSSSGDDGDGGSSSGGGGGDIDAGIDERHRRGHRRGLDGLGGSVGGRESGGEQPASGAGSA